MIKQAEDKRDNSPLNAYEDQARKDMHYEANYISSNTISSTDSQADDLIDGDDVKLDLSDTERTFKTDANPH